jgi:predicted nucleic acid-binding Zn ribbon protein
LPVAEHRRSRAGTGRKPVGNVLEAVMARYRLKGGVTRARAVVAWPRVAGPALARTTRAVAVREGVLVVETQDSVAANYLSLQRTDFLRRFREAIGEAAPRDLRFQAGAFGPPEPDAEEASEVSLPEVESWRVRALSSGASEDILPSVRKAAEAVLAVRELRLREGWAPCPACGTPTRDGDFCPPCQDLLESAEVLAAATRLECNPDLALGDVEALYPAANLYALECARHLALKSLEEQLDRLLADAVRLPDNGSGFEYVTYLRVLANAYLSLKLRLQVGEVARRHWRELPERVYHVLSAAEGGRDGPGI